jgi:hypothetical protein
LYLGARERIQLREKVKKREIEKNSIARSFINLPSSKDS